MPTNIQYVAYRQGARNTPAPSFSGVVPSFTAVYVDGRVVLTAQGWPWGASSFAIDRYDTAVLSNPDAVRAGTGAIGSVNDIVTVYDSEFTPNVANTYRLRVYAAGVLISTSYASPVVAAVVGTIMKSPLRPFLNRSVTVVGWSDVASQARGGVFEVLGRHLPIAITEVRGSRSYELTLMAANQAEADAIELFLSFGDTILLQGQANCPFPTFYAEVGDVVRTRKTEQAGTRRYFTLPLREVAAPDAAIAAYNATWTGIVSAFPTWNAFSTAFATWADAAAYVSNPSDEVQG